MIFSLKNISGFFCLIGFIFLMVGCGSQDKNPTASPEISYQEKVEKMKFIGKALASTKIGNISPNMKAKNASSFSITEIETETKTETGTENMLEAEISSGPDEEGWYTYNIPWTGPNGQAYHNKRRFTDCNGELIKYPAGSKEFKEEEWRSCLNKEEWKNKSIYPSGRIDNIYIKFQSKIDAKFHISTVLTESTITFPIDKNNKIYSVFITGNFQSIDYFEDENIVSDNSGHCIITTSDNWEGRIEFIYKTIQQDKWRSTTSLDKVKGYMNDEKGTKVATIDFDGSDFYYIMTEDPDQEKHILF